MSSRLQLGSFTPQDMLFLGDFNADCSYVRAQDWAGIRLRSSEIFKWLIPDSADTTVGNSDCAYDRIVACGAHLRKSLKPQSALVHDFQEAFGLDKAQVRLGPSRSWPGFAAGASTWHSLPACLPRRGLALADGQVWAGRWAHPRWSCGGSSQ